MTCQIGFWPIDFPPLIDRFYEVYPILGFRYKHPSGSHKSLNEFNMNVIYSSGLPRFGVDG